MTLWIIQVFLKASLKLSFVYKFTVISQSKKKKYWYLLKMKYIFLYLCFELACLSLFLGQWKQCCEELMKIEIMSPRKPPLFLTKEATSVYHDMSKWGLSFVSCRITKTTLSMLKLLILLTLK